MDQTLSIGWTAAQAANSRRTYRTILGINLAAHVVIGGLALFTPATLSAIFGLPGPFPDGWVRMWGAMLLIATLLYVPGWREPVRERFTNAVGIAGRFGMTTLYVILGGGFWWFALIDGAFAVLLFWSYFQLFRAELMSRP